MEHRHATSQSHGSWLLNFLNTKFKRLAFRKLGGRAKSKCFKGHKLWYACLDRKRSGVGILVANDILKQVVEVRSAMIELC